MAQLYNPCVPPPDPCRSPVETLFRSGISARQVPLCEPPACDCEAPSYGRMRIAMGGTLDRSRWLEGWIYMQLTTRGEVDCSVSATGQREGGWWADSFRRDGGFRTGSRLWALQGRMVNNETLITARTYATQALTYLLNWGIASKVSVDTSYVSKSVMRLAVDVRGPGNAQAATVTLGGQAMPAGGWLWRDYGT